LLLKSYSFQITFLDDYISGNLNTEEVRLKDDIIKAIGLVQPDLAMSTDLKVHSINGEASWYGNISVPNFRVKDSGAGTSFDLFLCKDKACQPMDSEAFRLVMPDSELPELEAGNQKFKARVCRNSVCGKWTSSAGYYKQKLVTNKALYDLIQKRARSLRSMYTDCNSMDNLLREWQNQHPGKQTELPNIMRNNLINLGPDYCYRLAVKGAFSALESTLETSSIDAWQSIIELDMDTLPGATLLSSGSTYFAATAMENAGKNSRQSNIPDIEKLLVRKKDLQVPRLSPEETKKFQELLTTKQNLWKQSSHRVASAALKTLDPKTILAVMGFILLQDDPESLNLTAKSSSPYQVWLLKLSEVRASMKEKEGIAMKLTKEIDSALANEE